MTPLRLSTWLALVLVAAPVRGDVAPHPSTDDVGLEPRLGEHLPRDVRLHDLDRGTVDSGDLLSSGRPVVLVLAYSDCPMLCSLVLRGLADAVREARLRPGRDYELVTVSIDPREPIDVARRSRSRLSALAGGHDAERWRYLLGREAEVERLAASLGFRYRYEPSTGQYAHPAAVFVIAGDGTIAQVIEDLRHEPGALDRALDAVAAGEVAEVSTLDAILRCFRFDPATRRYGTAITWALRSLAFLSLAVFAAAWALHRRRRT